MPVVSFAVPHINTKGHPVANCEQTRSPLPTLRSTSAYYHPHYPSNSPNADLVLASSDKIPCWFAISRAQLFCQDDPFRSVGLEIVTPDSNLPLVKLGESRAVIEVILACLQADTIPDFGDIDFRVLMSALEAAADKYKLVHMEKMCLLALGAYCRSHPVEVYTLASHYSCRWLAEAASEHTLSQDITQPEYQDILTSENHGALVSSHAYTHQRHHTFLVVLSDPIPLSLVQVELHRYRIEAAKSIVRSQRIAHFVSGHCDLSQLEAFWATSSETIISKINRPAIDFKELFAPELDLALEQFPDARSYAALVGVLHQVEREWQNVRRTVAQSPSTTHHAPHQPSPCQSDDEDTP